MAFYRCSYILRTGKVCNRGCYRPEGCKVHWDSPPRVPCKECGKLTYSGYDYCDTHADKYRRRDRYQLKKLEKMAQGGESKMSQARSAIVPQARRGDPLGS